MASSLWERVRRLEDCDALLGEMIHRMRHLSPTIQGLVVSLAAQKRFEKLEFLIRCRDNLSSGKPLYEVWRESLRDSGGLLGRYEAEALAGLADILGRTDMESQLDALRSTREALGRGCAQARENAARLSGMYRAIGMLSGAALFILLI